MQAEKFCRRKKDTRRDNLEKLFISYARDGNLDQTRLKEVFEHLGSYLPHKDAEVALKIAFPGKDTRGTAVRPGDHEFRSVVEYAYNKGFGYDI
ncbi:hypothetical protein DITRI_Ditri02bG0074100 [Diplodiscus trichospermus]